MRCWWVNQDKSYTEETVGGYLWCRQRRSNGARNPFYENLRLTHPGDILFAYAGGHIRAVGVVLTPCRESCRPGTVPPAPGESNDAAIPGWLIDVAWMELLRPLAPTFVMDILSPLLPEVHSPLTPDGRGLQGGRILELPHGLSVALLQLTGGARPEQLLNPVWRPRQLDLPLALANADASNGAQPGAEDAGIAGDAADKPETADTTEDAGEGGEDEPEDAGYDTRDDGEYDGKDEPEEEYVARDPLSPLAGIGPNSKMIAVDITKPFPFAEFFDTSRRIEIDVGCGKGRFLLAHAAAHPDTQMLGIERQLPRVRKIDKKAQRAGLENVRLLRLEAAYSLDYLIPENSIDRFYVLFPDPWPKRRHHSHRIFQPAFLDTLWKRLKDGGEVQVATDDADYFHDIVKIFKADPRFIPATPFERPPEEQTDFELIFRAKGFTVNAAAWRVEKDGSPKAIEYANE